MKLWQWVVGGALALALIGSVAFSGAQANALNDYRGELDSMYKKAWWEGMERLSTLEIELEKLMISDSPQAIALRLSNITRQADAAAQNLSALPIDRDGLNSALKFINQIADYAAALNEGIAQGRPISDDDIAQLQAISKRLASLNSIAYDMDALDDWAGQSALNIDMATLAEENLSYPTLIYDGPFSDGDAGAFKGLGAEKVDEQRAMQIATEFAGGAARVTGTATSPVQGFEITCATDAGDLELFVSETGGRVIYMLPSEAIVQSEVAASQIEGADAEALTIATDYLRAHGFGDMEPNYTQHSEGAIVINFAAVQSGVTLYPDLIKVQVSGGRVVGLEAGNYWRNHVTRALPAPAISIEQAQDAVNARLKVVSWRMALIPTERSDGPLPGEELCYEFTCALGDGRYLVYIDATTGLEARILKLFDDGAI